MRIISLLLLMSFLIVFSIRCSFASVIAGNQNSTVTLVEYYDYECSHCRRMESVIDRLQQNYPELQVIDRVTPLLTADSYKVASFTLATREQMGWQFWGLLHQRLMQLSRTPTLSGAQEVARELGLNTAEIRKSMQQSSVQQEIAKNINLAQDHAVNGAIHLPILVFGSSNGEGRLITLIGEQPYELLSAIVRQLLDDQHAQLAKKVKKTKISKSIKYT